MRELISAKARALRAVHSPAMSQERMTPGPAYSCDISPVRTNIPLPNVPPTPSRGVKKRSLKPAHGWAKMSCLLIRTYAEKVKETEIAREMFLRRLFRFEGRERLAGKRLHMNICS